MKSNTNLGDGQVIRAALRKQRQIKIVILDPAAITVDSRSRV